MGKDDLCFRLYQLEVKLVTMCLRNDSHCSLPFLAQEQKEKTKKSGSTDFGENPGPRVLMTMKKLPKTKTRTSVRVVVTEVEHEYVVRMEVSGKEFLLVELSVC